MRLSNFQKMIIADAALVENPTDLLYLTGLHFSCGTLAVTSQDAVLFVDGRYFAKAEREAPCAVRLLEGEALFDWLQGRKVRTLEFDSAFTSCDRFEILKAKLADVQLVSRSSLLQSHRSVKDANEIVSLRKACELTMRGFEHARSLLKEGVSEEEIAFEFEVFVRKNGASGLSFDSIIAFGENTAYPHYRPGKARLKKDQPVLIDVGAIVDSYHGDLTRVVFFGKADPILEKWLEWTKEAQHTAMKAARAGVRIGDLDRVARDVFARYGVEEYFTHGLGHGIGLETHEFPRIKSFGSDQNEHLRAGMVITIEPGLYRPGLGGVRFEDMFLISEGGCEKIGRLP